MVVQKGEHDRASQGYMIISPWKGSPHRKECGRALGWSVLQSSKKGWMATRSPWWPTLLVYLKEIHGHSINTSTKKVDCKKVNWCTKLWNLLVKKRWSRKYTAKRHVHGSKRQLRSREKMAGEEREDEQGWNNPTSGDRVIRKKEGSRKVMLEHDLSTGLLEQVWLACRW